MTQTDYAAALDAAEKSLAHKERGKPIKPKIAATEPEEDIHDLKARLNVLVPAMEQIVSIAQGSTSANSLPNIARIASLALRCQEPF